jgi:hypothetical protein
MINLATNCMIQTRDDILLYQVYGVHLKGDLLSLDNTEEELIEVLDLQSGRDAD